MTDNDHEEGPITRILRAAMRGAIAGGAAALPGGLDSAALGAAGGAFVGGATEVHAQLAPDERLARANSAATEESSLRVAAIERRTEAIASQLVAELSRLRSERNEERVDDFAATLVQLVQRGHVKPEEFDRDATREALVDGLRAAVEALTPEAVPMVTRLSTRPIDRFTRGVCRLLVELDEREIAELRELVGAVARAIPVAGTTTLLPPDASGYEALMVDPNLEAHPNGEIDLYGLDHCMVWHVGAGVRVQLDPESDVIRRLIVHRLASEPRWKRRSWGGSEDRRILRMTRAALLDLHFAITGERIEPPTDAPAPEDPT